MSRSEEFSIGWCKDCTAKRTDAGHSLEPGTSAEQNVERQHLYTERQRGGEGAAGRAYVQHRQGTKFNYRDPGQRTNTYGKRYPKSSMTE